MGTPSCSRPPQLRTISLEMVDPINWPYLQPYTGQYHQSYTYCTNKCGLQIARIAACNEWSANTPSECQANSACMWANQGMLCLPAVEVCVAYLLWRCVLRTCCGGVCCVPVVEVCAGYHVLDLCAAYLLWRCVVHTHSRTCLLFI